jgi:hypothetical protein
MRSLASVLHKSADERIKESKALINEFTNQEEVNKVMNRWKIKLSPEPLRVAGQRVPADEIEMDRNVKKFRADCNTNEFDRNIQAPMYS